MGKRGKKLINTFLIMCSLTFVTNSQVLAFQYNFKPNTEKIYKYQHWNTKRKKITGYTEISYQFIHKNNKSYVLEKSKNTTAEKTLFSEKEVWFRQKTGEWVYSEETDHRSNTTVFTEQIGSQINTRITDKNETKLFSVDEENGLISIELLTLYLQKNMDDLTQNSVIDFVLFIPQIAMELDKNGLPLSWSKLKMVATLGNSELVETPFGKQSAVSVLVEPGSFLIKSLLPKDKTSFQFIFQEQKPHLLLKFVENETEAVLTEIKDDHSNLGKMRQEN